MAVVISGTEMAAALRNRVATGVDQLRREAGVTPTLAVVLVGDDAASGVYVRQKVRQSAAVGIRSLEHHLSATTSEADLLTLVHAMNRDPDIHGVLVQLPLPGHIDASRVMDAIDPSKDVDGFHPVNVGRLSIGAEGLVPCTPLGCIQLLEAVVPDFRGLHAVVIGKSNIVGKPVAVLLLERECTVTVTHILTRDLPSIARTADILVVAAGSPGLVKGDWVKPGAVVIDVGINRVADKSGRTKLVGDVVSDEMDHAGALTPVPGGVGPMTIACLLSNTLEAARNFASARR